MTVARRLAFGFGVLLALLVLAVALGLHRLARLNAEVEGVVVGNWERTVLANRAIDLMNAQTRDTLELFLPGDPELARRRIANRVLAIGTLLDRLDDSLDHPLSRELFDEILRRRSAYVMSFSRVANLLDAGEREQAERLMTTETIPTLNAVLVSMEALIQWQGSVLVDTGATSLHTFADALKLLTGVLLAAVLAAVLLSSWIVRSVIRPLGGEPESVREVVERIASGDLEGDIQVRPGDRTSLLAAMGVMQDNLRRLIADRVHAERSEQASRARLQELVEALRDWVWEVDAEWRYTYVSPQVRDLLGYEPEDVLGRTPFDFMVPEDAERLRAAVNASRDGRQPITSLENVNLHRDGRRVVLETSGRPYYDADGEFAGYRGLDRDITDRKQAEANRLKDAERLRDALVREVHHRIKNNLQTVVGLLRREAGRRPVAREAIAGAINQVQAVAVVHGLYGHFSRHSIMLCELLPAVLDSVSDLMGVKVVRHGFEQADGRLLVRESETVAVALILNELMTNAVKHSLSVPVAQICADFELEGLRGCVRIRNPGRLPPGFDFAAGVGLGTGLGLVRALIPVPGVSIRFAESDAQVVVEMSIEAPVLMRQEAGVRAFEFGTTGEMAEPT
ncbi:sensor histidine kinase [Thauera mechernichensis]